MSEPAGEKNVQSFEFKAEIKKLLDIIIHSLYTNREIFLRELISNASDALDKVRFEMNSGREVLNPDSPLEIRISLDEKANMLSIADTGIGMSKEELIENIGTIARSGSEEFLKKIAESKEGADGIIGRFGVGFYSVFMVAKEVVITTRSCTPDIPAVGWKSDGLGSYRIFEPEDDLPRGTRIEVYFKDDIKDFIQAERIKDIIKTHSGFIAFPIYVGDEQVNTISALWREPKFNIKQEQYNEFYKFLTHDFEDPFETIHLSVDAPVQFTGLLFIPGRSRDMFGFYQKEYGLDLYVRRVLINRRNKELLPEYLGFVQGLADTEDLPLNISRETLQENLMVGKMGRTITAQILSRLEKITKEAPDRYIQFWKEHGKQFKLGYTDFNNREKYSELLRFDSSFHDEPGKFTSLGDYLSRIKISQKEIYYISGPSREAVLSSPHLEIFRQRGLEVLFLYEPIDEFIMETLRKFREYDFKAVENADLGVIEKFDVISGEKPAEPELSGDEESSLEGLLKKIKEILGDRITEVRLSKRLSKSPACLAGADGQLTSHMEKIMKIMTKDTAAPKKVFEINKDHHLIRNLIRIYGKNPEDAYLKNAVEQLFDASLLQDGWLSDPHALVGRINSLLEESSGWYVERI